MNTKALKAKRVLLGIKQNEIASKLNISSTTYSLKETGKIEFKRNEIEKLAKILLLTIEEINDIFFDDKLPTNKV